MKPLDLRAIDARLTKAVETASEIRWDHAHRNVRETLTAYNVVVADMEAMLADAHRNRPVIEEATALMQWLNEHPGDCPICNSIGDEHDPDMPCGTLWAAFGKAGA